MQAAAWLVVQELCTRIKGSHYSLVTSIEPERASRDLDNGNPIGWNGQTNLKEDWNKKQVERPVRVTYSMVIAPDFAGDLPLKNVMNHFAPKKVIDH